MQKRRGLLITFEGGEGGGKTTQAGLLVARLREAGKEVVAAREPGGTRVGEQIREVVLSCENQEIVPATEVLLFQAARAQIYAEVVRPALEAGKIVVMDRTGDSSIVYQGMIRGLGADFIRGLNRFSMQNIRPDLTFLLDVPAKTGLERKQDDENLRLEGEGLSFHQKVRKGFLELAAENERGRWRVIDAKKSIEQVADLVWQEVENFRK